MVYKSLGDWYAVQTGKSPSVQPKGRLIYVPLIFAVATLHIFYLFLCSFSDSEVALALKEQSIICLACLINIGYIVVLTPGLGVFMLHCQMGEVYKAENPIKKNNTAYLQVLRHSAK